ncbi:GntR family transcriptional regulator [Azomonas macrocytogenes]|uniref:GntR family transcriptional regulator n=1 Tax=Azomonas macrocytogenes TaxID=69962 RepID=A0A839T7D5_AZOMA|nr:GntR family transcriptional regulator [Azomonas macrocytogenes]MBB3105372.1 GntR family transcriptional regulator [Azomonas macrocytogenes]
MSDSANMLRRDHGIPLYEQMASALRQEITGGRYGAAGRLPAEAELSARFAVSRVTVRQALDLLVQENLIEKRHGKGSFVASKRLWHELDVLRGFYDELVLRGVDPETELLEFKPRALPRAWIRDLDWPGDGGIFLQRLYRVRGQTLALSSAYLHPQAAIVDRVQAACHPIYSIFETLLRKPVECADISISVMLADLASSALLDLKPGAPLLAMRRTSYLANGSACERTTFLIRPEGYEFVLHAGGNLSTRKADPSRAR